MADKNFASKYMSGEYMPEHLLETVGVQSPYSELNRHVATMNDIVSPKKEIVRPAQFHFPCNATDGCHAGTRV
jgi:hypothetical protein